MNDYMLLFRGEDEFQRQTPEEMKAHMGRWETWMGGLAESGKLLGGHALNPTPGYVIQGQTMQVTDGPYAEGKEMVGGYVTLKAETLEAAMELGKGCPILEFSDSTVEVRELTEEP